MKFDVVVGNPPFQDNKDIDINGGSNKKLWKDFLYLSINNILKHEGYLCMICPFSWNAARKNPLNSINIYNDIIKKYNTIYIDTIQSNASFNIGIKVCYLIIKKIPYEHKTYLDNHIIDLAKWKSLPVDTSSVSLNIWDKINKFQKLNCIMVRKTINNKYCSNKKTKDNIYKLYTGSNNIIYTSIISEYYNRKKIIIHRMGNFICYIDGNGDVNPVYSHIYLLSNAEKGEYFKDILENKKLFRFLMNNLKTTQYNESYNTNKLPKIDFSRSWTDTELYKFFNLTQEEIDFIESQVK